MKKIYVSAYFNNNLGDDLFVDILVNRYPNTKFYISDKRDNVRALSNQSNVHFKSSFAYYFEKILKRIGIRAIVDHNYYRADGFVKIGGSIFKEYENWEDNWIDFDRGPMFIIGSNFGPYKSSEYKEIARSKIEKAYDCCFRDRTSFKLFSNLPNVRCAPDVVFGLTYLNNKVANKKVGISVIDLNKRIDLKPYAEQYYSTLAIIADKFISKKIKVTLISFCENEGDGDAIESVKSRMKLSKCTEEYHYNGNIQSALDEISSCNGIIATRFHAMILGLKMNKRVYPIIYSEKQKYVIDDLMHNMDYSYISDFNVEKTEDVIEWYYKDNESINLDIFTEALRQFEALDSYLLES